VSSTCPIRNAHVKKGGRSRVTPAERCKEPEQQKTIEPKKTPLATWLLGGGKKAIRINRDPTHVGGEKINKKKKRGRNQTPEILNSPSQGKEGVPESGSEGSGVCHSTPTAQSQERWDNRDCRSLKRT